VFQKVTFLANAKLWKCRNAHPKQKFSVKVGTIFEDSPIGLDKWFPAMWLAANCKNGIALMSFTAVSAVTQKDGLVHVATYSAGDAKKESPASFVAELKQTKTYIGAKARYMHKDKRTGVGHAGLRKTAVQGILERNTDKKNFPRGS